MNLTFEHIFTYTTKMADKRKVHLITSSYRSLWMHVTKEVLQARYRPSISSSQGILEILLIVGI